MRTAPASPLSAAPQACNLDPQAEWQWEPRGPAKHLPCPFAGRGEAVRPAWPASARPREAAVV
eukprot:7360050-Lingulodinium_polyedra.AAC.1